jgi:hypothetical protein
MIFSLSFFGFLPGMVPPEATPRVGRRDALIVGSPDDDPWWWC